MNNTLKTDVALWCHQCSGWLDQISPGGLKKRAPNGANKGMLIISVTDVIS